MESVLSSNPMVKKWNVLEDVSNVRQLILVINVKMDIIFIRMEFALVVIQNAKHVMEPNQEIV